MPRYTSPPEQHIFYEQAWALVQQIPPGKVTTYGQIARWLAAPAGMDEKSYLAFGARWVGGAMANCPDGIPWWRVVNAKGEISPRPGAAHQKTLLEEEGLVFNKKGRLDLQQSGWNGLDE